MNSVIKHHLEITLEGNKSKMKLFGYQIRGRKLHHLQEVSIQANAATFRYLARFIEHAAQLIEEHGESFGHIHLKDWDKTQDRHSPDILVAGMGKGEREDS